MLFESETCNREHEMVTSLQKRDYISSTGYVVTLPCNRLTWKKIDSKS